MAFHWNKNRGQVLIELLVAIGVAVVMIPAIFSGFAASREGKGQQSQRLAATSLAEEALEAIRVVREAGWENVETNGVYHPEISGSTWILVAGSETVDSFTRSLTVSDVYRDANGNIVVDGGGTIDPSTKKVNVVVSWTAPLANEVNFTTYLTRLTNEEYIDTTVADFEAGVNYNTTVTNNLGGEVQLGGGGKANWCTPALTINALDLPRSGDALSITAIPGTAFAGTGRDASGVSFAKIDITDTDPPVATSPSSNWFNGYKTNQIFGETGYSYLATDTNSKEIVIINLGQTPYTEVGSFDSPGVADANSIFVLGNVGYMTAGNTLNTFDLSSKSGSRPLLGSVGLAGNGTKIYVVGTYAYVSTSNSSAETQVIDVTNPASPVVVGQANTDSGGGVDLYVNETGSRVYLATAASGTQREMFIINTEVKTGDRPVVGSYDTNGMDPKGVRVVPGNRALIAGYGEEEYQAINIVDETSPFRCGGINIDSGVNSLWSVVEADGDAYSYLATQDANAEFKIIEGGPGGAYSNQGVFTSRVLDAGKDTAFNRFLVTYSEPIDTRIRFQVGVGDQVSGICDPAALTYVGPDKTSDTFYDDGGLIPFDDDGFAYENPARCFAYKAYLDANTGSPILYDFTLNYSP
ncbi:hypothetical protein HYT59_00290 [Candidatus Woesebacteria bacterium]|nr:hypothetical protein [Candidatus Woesebacteria bacterium]